jgi:DNA-3-methyladenine glycosylase II
MASRVSIESCRAYFEGYEGNPAFDFSGLRTPLDSGYMGGAVQEPPAAACPHVGVDPKSTSRRQKTGRPEVDKVTAATIDRSFDPHIYRVLGAREPVLAGLIATYGYPPPFEWHDGGRTADSQFAAMLLHIAGQQISASVAFRIYDRVAAACGDIPSAAAVLTIKARRLEAAGLSRAKASYIMALARAQADGVIDIEAMSDVEDEQVIAQLTAIRGIGLWSAQTFLIHNLARPDVLPAGDLGIRRACAALWTMSSLPSPGAVKTRSAAWAPYRSYASALLWCSLAPVGEESDPKARALQRNAASVARPRRR